MGKIVIGIHGLANKPKREKLSEWWKASLVEGFQNRQVQDPAFQFRMVYWADRLYKNPMHTDALFSFDRLYNDEPYKPVDPRTLKVYNDTWCDDLRAAALDIAGSSIDSLKQRFGMNALADWILGKLLKDMAFYYDNNRQIKNRLNQPEQARKVLQDELKSVLVEEKANEVMVIAHSMGSIIAYDVLRDLGQSDQNVEVSHFVTIGSPLGLPHVKGKIILERGYDPKVRTPSIVTKSWINFADRKDPVAVDIHLRDDYAENAKGVKVRDDLVQNDYYTKDEKNERKNNHHKSYGYLRTPELSDHVKAFLWT